MEDGPVVPEPVAAQRTPRKVDCVVELMRKYSDQPMSLADASIVSVAEVRSIKTVFSLDSDFTFAWSL